jgi:rhodanese-related sulfurtransferase
MKEVIARQMLALCVVAFLPAIGEAFYFRDKIPWQTPVAPSEYATLATIEGWGSDVLWVDARTDADYANEHIPGAFSLNEDRWNELLPRMFEKWAPGKKIVVYCSSHSCNLSREVAHRLRTELQLPDVYILQGGWEEWLKAHPK